MSTLKVTNIQDTAGGNSATTAQIYSGIAKAWVNFNGTTASPSTIRASFNVSSITKNGTGDYAVNFSSALVDGNYSVVVAASTISPTSGTNTLSKLGFRDDLTVPTANSVRIVYTGSVFADPPYACVSIFR